MAENIAHRRPYEKFVEGVCQNAGLAVLEALSAHTVHAASTLLMNWILAEKCRYRFFDFFNSISPQETNRIFAVCARSTVHAATAKTSVSQRGMKTSRSFKLQHGSAGQRSSRGLRVLSPQVHQRPLLVHCFCRTGFQRVRAFYHLWGEFLATNSWQNTRQHHRSA